MSLCITSFSDSRMLAHPVFGPSPARLRVQRRANASSWGTWTPEAPRNPATQKTQRHGDPRAPSSSLGSGQDDITSGGFKEIFKGF